MPWARHDASHRLTSEERYVHRPQSRQFHLHFVTGTKPQGLDQTAGENDFTRAQALAVRGEMIGQPRQRVMRMVQHIGAGAPPCFNAIDDGAADYITQPRPPLQPTRP